MLLALAAAALLSAAAGAPPALADPPGRVGRLSAVEGTASMRVGGDGDEWSIAPLNAPVTSGNDFWVQPDSRAEIRVGPTALRLDGGTELRIVRLDDRALRADVPQGALDVTLGDRPPRQPGETYEIGTPRGIVALGGPGTYHIEAGSAEAPTRVAVLTAGGVATIAAGNGSQMTVHQGESADVGGDGNGAISYATGPAQPTPFDRWALARDERDRAAAEAAARYVPPAMTGYEDLGAYGTWQPEPAYGTVWYPQAVPADWAPYRYGQWRWVEPWGWTWIDEAPWGFAPFHYGRWAYIGNRWGWVPGAVAARPVYAPALVVFVGDGPRWHGFNHDEHGHEHDHGQGRRVGWIPLGPREVYRPPYRASATYIRNVNVTHVTNISNTTVNVTNATYANRRFATVVPRADFVAARPVARAAVAVPAATLATAPASPAPPVRHDAAVAFAGNGGRRPEGAEPAPHPPPHATAAAAVLGVGAVAGAAAAAHAAGAHAAIPPNSPVAGAGRDPAWHGGPPLQQQQQHGGPQQPHGGAPFAGPAHAPIPASVPHPPSVAAVRAPAAPRPAAAPQPAPPGRGGPANVAAGEPWRQQQPQQQRQPANSPPPIPPHPATPAAAATAPMPRPHQAEFMQQQQQREQHAMTPPSSAAPPQPRPQLQPQQQARPAAMPAPQMHAPLPPPPAAAAHAPAPQPHPRSPEPQRHENGGGNGGGGAGRPRPPHGAGNG
ncbi:MAG TPA: DUF6600 domain-containing protein [Stellaceae bacterium]